MMAGPVQPEPDGLPPAALPGNLPPELAALALQMLAVPEARENAVTLNLTEDQTGQLIDQAGRKSDQEHSFKKWLLVAAALAFFLILLTTVGLVVFLTLQDEVAFASEIIAGAFGLISGLVTGVGGTLGFIALRQWSQ